ncbi:exonuclease SbcC [Minicystis rosea]|nr:exonuclease SbcC [Minicystis rosea]
MRDAETTMPRRGAREIATLVAAAALAACGGSLPADGQGAGKAAVALPAGHPARIEVRRLDARPRLTLVSRDGDPMPALAAVVLTGLGPAPTTALAAVVEGRLRAAGFDVDVRVDRDAFRIRALLADAGRASGFFAALVAAVGRPIAAGSAEVALAAQRVASLKRNPLDAAELVPVAACTGMLGVAPGEAIVDPATDAGLREIEAARQRTLHAGHVSVAAVGPAAFTAAVAQALERSSGWPAAGGTPDVAAPAADTTGVYVAPALSARGGRISLAVHVADPELAAAVAERLGAADSPLVARLRVLPEPWRLAQIAGVARAQGGCVGAVLETTQHGPGQSLESAAAIVAGLARREIAADIAAGGGGAVAGRQILTASDPRDAASRAAWWAMAGNAPAGPLRWATALGAPAPRDGSAPTSSAARFQTELDRALTTSSGAERRLTVERGQGELWMLLASPCGVADETTADAGLGAVAVLAGIEARRRPGDVTVEPWITADGLGVMAHAAFRDERETGEALARRVADAAARALTAAVPSNEAVQSARTAVLDHLERTAGHQGAAEGALVGAISADHPSWVEPFGLFRRVVESSAESVRARGQALAFGPLRLAVLANGDAAQAAAAADAVDRWLSPAPGPRVCRAGAASLPRPGHLDVKLPDGAPLAQGLIGAALPLPPAPGALPYAYRDLAELTVAALDGPGGLLANALGGAAATATARVLGGSRAPSLVVDVRAPEGSLASAVSDVKALLLRLPSTATEGDLVRAFTILSRREQDARADPRRRLADLWSGRPAPGARPTLAAWRTFLGAALREPALSVVEARP